MNNLENLCTWKVLSNNKGTTFKDVKKGNELYDCTVCSGKPDSCPNYVNHDKLIEKYK